MPTYYVDNKPVQTKVNFSFNNVRDSIDYKEYWKTANHFKQVVSLIVNMIQTQDDLADSKTGEFIPNFLAEQLLDMAQFEQINDKCDIEFIDWLVFCVADELGVI